MSALGTFIEARKAGIELVDAGGVLKCRGRPSALKEWLPVISEHRRNLLAILHAEDLFRRLEAACVRLGLPVDAVLAQFSSWEYPATDLEEMGTWDDPVIEQHVQLLMHEIRNRISGRPSSHAAG